MIRTKILVNILCILTSCLSLPAISQEPNYIQYTVEHGLPSNTVYTILQGSDNFIWICGDAGISRFDGKNFLNFGVKEGLQDNEILKIVEDQNERIWYFTLKGDIGYIENGKINQLPELNKQIKGRVTNLKRCVDNCMALLIVPDSIYHVNHNSILFRQKGSSYYDQNINHQFFNKDGSWIMLGTNAVSNNSQTIKDILIRKIDHPHQTLREYYTPVKKNHSYIPKESQFFTNCSYVLYINDRQEVIEALDDQYLRENSAICMLQSHPNELVIGTHGGLFQYEVINGKLEFKKHIFRKFKISSIIQDKEGNTFLSTLGKGLIQIPNKKIIRLDNPNSGENITTCFAYIKDKQKIIYGADNGEVNIVNRVTGKVSEIKNRTQQPFERVKIIFPQSNSAYIATDLRLWLYDLDKGYINVYSDSAGISIKSLAINDTSIWLGSHCDLRQIDKHFNPITLIPCGRTGAIFDNKRGDVWFSNDQGLNKLTKKKIKNYSKFNPLFQSRFLKIEENDHFLWLASQGKGLIIYNLKSGRLVHIGSLQGLADDICNSFLIDHNKIWVATNSGVSKITFSSADKTKYVIQNIGAKQGLNSNNIRQIIKIDSLIYVATSKGICSFKEPDIPINTYNPPIYINNIKLWDKDTAVLSSYTFDYFNNNIRIGFIGLAFKTGGDVRYLYKMIGLDSNWIQTHFTSVSYPSLPPGKYTFLVKAINEDGIESDIPATVSFFIKTPYWQKWGFWIIIALISGGLIWWMMSLRIKNIRHRNNLYRMLGESEQKALRTQMNPHFVFNSLNSIQRFITKNDSREAHIYLAKFGKLIRAIFETSSKRVLSLYEEIETLNLYLELEWLRFDHGFDYQFYIDPSIDIYTTEIPTMIIQPYIENAIWHGLMHKKEKGSLTISILPQQGGIHCRITDNGIGREAAKLIKSQEKSAHKSSAMNITAQRLQILKETTGLNYSVEIEDLYDSAGSASGTQVNIYLSVN